MAHFGYHSSQAGELSVPTATPCLLECRPGAVATSELVVDVGGAYGLKLQEYLEFAATLQLFQQAARSEKGTSHLCRAGLWDSPYHFLLLWTRTTMVALPC